MRYLPAQTNGEAGVCRSLRLRTTHAEVGAVGLRLGARQVLREQVNAQRCALLVLQMACILRPPLVEPCDRRPDSPAGVAYGTGPCPRDGGNC